MQAHPTTQTRNLKPEPESSKPEIWNPKTRNPKHKTENDGQADQDLSEQAAQRAGSRDTFRVILPQISALHFEINSYV